MPATLLPAALWLAACSGADAPEDAGPVVRDGGPTPDGGPAPDAGGPVDAGPLDGGPVDDQQVAISGRVLRLDSFLDDQDVAVNAASIRALGAAGVDPAGSEADGTYSIRVPENGTILLAASKAGYLQTYNQLRVAAIDIPDYDFLLAYQPHIDRVAERFGIENWGATFPCHAPRNSGNCRYAIVMGEVVDDGSADNGRPTPLGDVEADDFTIRVGGYDDWYTRGPYFFFFNGQPNPNVTSTQRQRNERGQYVGGLFAYFVEIPAAGEASREVEVSASSYAGGPARRYFGPRNTLAFRDGFTWVSMYETGVAPPPPPPDPDPPPPENVDFATQVYPLFQTVDQGGLGCQGCHTNQGGQAPSGGLNLYGGPDAAYAALNPEQYPQRVNVQNPAQSYLLRRPLYEPDGNQDHPIFAFLSTQDPAYRTVLGWITEGALYEGGVPPPPVSFTNDVRPILYADAAAGGAGCRGCHVDGVNANNAPGGAYFGGTPEELYEVIVNQTPSDNYGTGEPYRINKEGNVGQSLLLTNPLIGAPEPHPGKLFNGTQDPRYETIYRWISEGYPDDTP